MEEKVIVAFENSKSADRIRDIIEVSGLADCVVCRSAAEVKRAVSKQHIFTVVCGFKLPDQSAEDMFQDLPPSCSMLMIASQSILDVCSVDDIFKLASPVRKGDLEASVRMLLQMSHRLERFVRPRRSDDERALVERAKLVLIDRNGMTEDQAHRFLQKKSMDAGAKLSQTAKLILDGQ